MNKEQEDHFVAVGRLSRFIEYGDHYGYIIERFLGSGAESEKYVEVLSDGIGLLVIRCGRT
jgi:hypothetical protein